MARVNFREIQDRFTHIDAEFVFCNLASHQPKYVVRFYPWWEHPACAEAIATGQRWEFAEGSNPKARKVTVYPIGVHEYRIGLNDKAVIDWAFIDAHPLLWPYEDRGDIYCNSGFDRAELVRRIMARGLPYVDKTDLYKHVDPLLEYPPPFALAQLPFSLFRVVREELVKMDVRMYVPREPEPCDTPMLLLIHDAYDYIIADDFELDVPTFKHRPSWCKIV